MTLCYSASFREGDFCLGVSKVDCFTDICPDIDKISMFLFPIRAIMVMVTYRESGTNMDKTGGKYYAADYNSDR